MESFVKPSGDQFEKYDHTDDFDGSCSAGGTSSDEHEYEENSKAYGRPAAVVIDGESGSRGE